MGVQTCAGCNAENKAKSSQENYKKKRKKKKGEKKTRRGLRDQKGSFALVKAIDVAHGRSTASLL